MQATIKRAPTGDRGPPGQDTITVDILTNEQLGPRMSKLPNGSLLCRDVPVGRVGWMIYGPGETPISVAPDTGVAYVERTADELFSPETIGSFMAATVTDDHPASDVIPSNWRDHAKGFTTTNVRRGTGDNADILLADLVITDAALIRSVLSGKREVSLGYEADYFQTAPGIGRQTNIRGNHIALVEKGRCGPRCAIGDRAHSPPTEGKSMTTKRVNLKTPRRELADDAVLEGARQRVLDAQADLESLQQEGEQEEQGAVHVHIHQGAEEPKGEKATTTDKRIDAIEATVGELGTKLDQVLAKLAPAAPTAEELAATAEAAAALAKAKGEAGATDDELDPVTGKTADSAALATSYTKVLAQAEVLVPGFRMPTFDAALKRKVTIDNMCQARRRCLDMAYATVDGQKLIDGILDVPGQDLTKLDCAATAVLFNAAASAKAASNNRSATGDSGAAATVATEVAPSRPSFADINKANEAFWAKHQVVAAP